MRMPGRFHITWQDDTTLRVESDAGMQTRTFHFNASRAPAGERTWQGYSVAQWQMPSLKVATTNLRAGYLRKNGVPYSENAVVTEFFDRHTESNGEWFTVTTIVDDPKYLQQSFITSTDFRSLRLGTAHPPRSAQK